MHTKRWKSVITILSGRTDRRAYSSFFPPLPPSQAKETRPSSQPPSSSSLSQKKRGEKRTGQVIDVLLLLPSYSQGNQIKKKKGINAICYTPTARRALCVYLCGPDQPFIRFDIRSNPSQNVHGSGITHSFHLFPLSGFDTSLFQPKECLWKEGKRNKKKPKVWQCWQSTRIKTGPVLKVLKRGMGGKWWDLDPTVTDEGLPQALINTIRRKQFH